MTRRSFAAAATMATIALSVAVLGTAATAADFEQPPPVKQYKIAWRLVRTAPDGQCEALTAPPPHISKEGEVDCLCVGNEIPVPQKAHLRENLFRGITCEATVHRTEQGRLMLDTKIEIATVADPNPTKDSVRLATVGLRVVEPITLGEKTTIALPAGDKSAKQHVELVVTEVNARETAVSPVQLRLSEGVVGWRAHPIE